MISTPPALLMWSSKGIVLNKLSTAFLLRALAVDDSMSFCIATIGSYNKSEVISTVCPILGSGWLHLSIGGAGPSVKTIANTEDPCKVYRALLLFNQL